ncbi:amidohydrolase family protein [Sphingomicrobium lutaoense]|uniref:Imidazolonepropionase-like amidohydrolase n=1 Tax=Sphingomicrobium lutaoense TaxID=515949 RepID=A0A839YYP2_9SPHN|nr:amidohydrolase family protein [Sphingomicrobium lutaoense]MBB3764106.1 imidazolonepropionase-like amidohydrolase [Sphingomicrobium lutaoense]
MLTTALIALTAATQAQPSRCELVLEGANVFTGSGFVKRDLALSGGRFVADVPQDAERIDAARWTLLPPIADVHTHMIDQPRPGGARGHSDYLDQGIYYVLNPNNIRFDDALPASAATVDGSYTGGGLTGPGGHPRPLYENLVDWGVYRMKKEDLAGKAYHEVASDADARAAVAEVKRQGASHIKLYLTHHDQPDSDGLTPDNFRSAVRHAKAAGLHPIVHVNSRADFRLAVEEDVFALVHMPGAWPRGEAEERLMLTPEDARIAADNGVFVIPTLAVGFNALFGEDLEAARDIWRHNLKLMKDAGVRFGAGADRGGATALSELAVLHSTGLFSGEELVEIATTNGIEIALPDREVGRLGPGQEASFIVMGFNPAESWYSWSNPLGGMRGGVTVRGDIFPESCAP